MYTENQICEKIRSVYPDIGACGIDLNVKFSPEDSAWIVHLSKGSKQLKTFLEPDDANLCMEDKQCVSLGFEIYQLQDNINQLRYS